MPCCGRIYDLWIMSRYNAYAMIKRMTAKNTMSNDRNGPYRKAAMAIMATKNMQLAMMNCGRIFGGENSVFWTRDIHAVIVQRKKRMP